MRVKLGFFRIVLVGLFGLGFAAMGPGHASETSQDLIRVLRVIEVTTAMQQEGVAHAASLDAEMLDGSGGQPFRDRVSKIYDPARGEHLMAKALKDGMSDADISASMAFFTSPLGQKILTLENSARAAMIDPAIEDAAREVFENTDGTSDLLLKSVTRFVVVNDLLERNVAGALTSNYHFYRGLVDGGAMKMDDDMILADVWQGEADVRADTRSWLYGFLLMAYKPLQAGELDAYSDFSQTKAGRALNAALFAGFDQMYEDISYALGQTVAQAMTSKDI